MYGIVLTKTILLVALLTAALISDIKTYKIRNFIILIFTIPGVFINVLEKGVNGLFFAAAGWIVPVLLLFLLYALNMLGAGDIKLFGTIGAMMGSEFAVHCVAYSFIFGGITGFILILVRRNAAARCKVFITYLKSCFLTLKLMDYSEFTVKSTGHRFPLAYCIMLGTLAQLVSALTQGGHGG